MIPSIQFDGQQRNPLTDVVMQLSRDPRTFLFVGVNQLATHVAQRFLRELAISYVHARAYVAGKRTVRIESRHAYVGHPAIFSIMPPQPILHFETVPALERSRIGIQARTHVIGVHYLSPAVAK